MIIGGVWMSKKPVAPVASEPIKIGVIAPLTGVVADYGEEIRKGAMAGAAGKNVELVYEDDKCDPKEAVSAFQKLTGFQKISFLIGPACGSPQEAIVPLLNNQKILALVPAAASADLYQKSGNNFFNIQYSLQDESTFIANKMYELGYKNVALISYGNAFSQAHADAFRAAFKGKIVIESKLLDDSSDVSTEIAKINLAKVDAIYSPDISFFFASGLSKLRQQKVAVPVFSTYVVELPAVRALVSDVFYSYPAGMADAEAAVFGLTREATALLTDNVVACAGDYECVKDKLISSSKFNDSGVYQRDLILKQIKDGVPVKL